MSDKTELQRQILETAYRNPNASKKEISEMCDCSASYVSNVLNRYDEWDALDSDLEQMNRDLGFNSSRGLSQQPRQQPAWSDGGFENAEPADAEDVAEFIDTTIEASQTLFTDKSTSMSTGQAVVSFVMSGLVILLLTGVAIYAISII